MALVYQNQLADSHYEVRSAGASLRLYSNGVLHSQYNPNTPISGGIWDLLLLPGFFKETPPKRILVLGLGGGTIVHLIKAFFPESLLTCVELDKQHIDIAQQFFVIPSQQVEVIHADAYEYLSETSETFDWIVDDVFQHVSGEPTRAKSLNDIFPLYLQRLKPQGMLSANLIGSEQYKQMKSFSENFTQGYQFNHPMYENRIICLSSAMCSTAQFRLNLKQFKVLDQSRKSCKLNYRLRKL